MIEKLRVFFVILEEGSLRRAAERVHLSQSAITRQIQLLEHDLGGRILERTSSGVQPTAAGHALAEKATALLADYDSVMGEIRRLVRGETDRLRIGYIAAAVQRYLEPALTILRRTYPKLKVKCVSIGVAAVGCGQNSSCKWSGILSRKGPDLSSPEESRIDLVQGVERGNRGIQV